MSGMAPIAAYLPFNRDCLKATFEPAKRGDGCQFSHARVAYVDAAQVQCRQVRQILQMLQTVVGDIGVRDCQLLERC